MTRRPGDVPLLSVAMIVRDEAALLGECIANIGGNAEEICIVDTGSEDGSPAIAEAAGCRVARFDWRQDFSAARNASLALCRGAWIFVLDADERLSPADWQALRALTDGGAGYCYRFTTRNYTDNEALTEFTPCVPGESEALLPAAAAGKGFAGWYPSTKVRLFPNVPAARFEGEVHEMVNAALTRAGLDIHTSSIPIHHYPQVRPAEQQTRKQAMYVELGLEKLRRDPDDAYAHAELGDQYADMGQYAGAVSAYREALRRDPDNAAWLTHLGGALHLLGRAGEAEQALNLALRRAPDSIGAWRNLAAVQSGGGRWEDAVHSLGKAVALSPDSAALRGDLALALESCGRLSAAAAAARASLEARPMPGPAVSRYAGLMERLGRAAEARAFLEGLAEATGDSRLLDPYEA